jgi:signal transduction histidine kinase
MFWKRLKAFARTLSFRLNLWYAVVFVVSSALVFALLYYLLGAAIDRKDREVIEARLGEYVAVYENGGVPALQAWITRVDEARKQRTFFVRVATRERVDVLLVVPQDWLPEDVAHLDVRGEAHPRTWLRVPRDEEVDFTVASTFLRGGTFFQVGRSSESRERLLRRFREAFAVVLAPVLLLGFLGGALLTRRFTRPIRHLGEAVRAIIDTGKMTVRVPTRRADDELEDLIVLFNRMLDGNEGLFRALRESLDNVAHDLRTPLSRLRASVEDALTHSPAAGPARGVLADALEETERVETIIRTLMDVAQAEAGVMRLRFQPTDLGTLVDAGLELYADVAAEKEIVVEKQFHEPLVVPADAPRIRQVFANLLDNALKYTPRGGRVAISASSTADEAVVCFGDNGPGIAPEDLSRIWDRLYRGDKSRAEHGLGLGLSLVKAIVEAHGGRAEVVCPPGGGAIFCVRLPRTARVPASGGVEPNPR